MLGLGVAWGVLLAAGAVYMARYGEATVREQRSISQAQPVVDRATSVVLGAAGPDTAAEISGYELRAPCKISAARPGVNYQRVVNLYVKQGEEKALLEKLRAGLPASYDAQIKAGTLWADAGEFVRVTGTVPGPGQVRVSSYTGCRPEDTLATFKAAADDRGLGEALALLAVQPADRQVHQVLCATTVTASAPGASPGPLPEKFAGKTLVLSTPDKVVYRERDVTIVVSASGGELTLSQTVANCTP